MPVEMTMPMATLVLLVALALAFDFMNGFHDAANSIATVVSTGVLRPHYAVAWAAFFNFVAIFIFHLKVAATVGKGIVEPDAIDQYVIFGALIGAISWNLITWYYGIPFEFVARADRRHDRCGTGEGRDRPAGRQGHHPHGDLHLRLADARHDARCAADDRRLLGLPEGGTAQGGPLVPATAAGLVRGLQHRPRQQRRAEDHGHHLAAADRGGRDLGGRRDAAQLGDRQLLRRDRASARCSAAGAS